MLAEKDMTVARADMTAIASKTNLETIDNNMETITIINEDYNDQKRNNKF